MNYAIGIDLGGSSVKTVAITPEGKTLAESTLNFDTAAKMDWAQKVRELVEQIQREQKTGRRMPRWQTGPEGSAVLSGATRRALNRKRMRSAR